MTRTTPRGVDSDGVKACPFCSSIETAYTSNGVENYCIFCISCGAEGPASDSKEDAKDRWNAAP